MLHQSKITPKHSNFYISLKQILSQLRLLKNRFIVSTKHRHLPIHRLNHPLHHRRVLPRRYNLTLDPRLRPHGQRPQIRRIQIPRHVPRVEKPRLRNRQQRRAGEAIEDGGCRSAVQVSSLVAEFGRDGEFPGGGLGGGAGGEEDALPEAEDVVAVVAWGGG